LSSWKVSPVEASSVTAAISRGGAMLRDGVPEVRRLSVAVEKVVVVG
jgi:hypothetical protein